MTTCLDLDVGNSRIKWRFGRSEGIASGDQLPNVNKKVARIRISTVRGNEADLSLWSKRLYGIEPEFAVASKSLAGVTNAYSDPHTLGVDRWLALCAAWNASTGSCIVIDAGTALTIDVVAENGRHLGGYIVPGLATMQRHLWDTTEQVKVQSEDLARTDVYGTDTKSCVANGTLRMCIEFINGVSSSSGLSTPTVFLTGGDAEPLLPHLNTEVLFRPYLVLDGLALALP